METSDNQLCRLCAKNKFPGEIVGQITNQTLDIESKLIACCRWNTLNEIKSNKLPQNVCVSCFRILQQCWDFTEQIRNAQFDLFANLLDKSASTVKSNDDQNSSTSKSSESNLTKHNELFTHLEDEPQLSAPSEETHPSSGNTVVCPRYDGTRIARDPGATIRHYIDVEELDFILFFLFIILVLVAHILNMAGELGSDYS